MVMERATWQLCSWESGAAGQVLEVDVHRKKLRGQGKEHLINMVMLAPLIAGSGHFQKIIQHIKD